MLLEWKSCLPKQLTPLTSVRCGFTRAGGLVQQHSRARIAYIKPEAHKSPAKHVPRINNYA